MFQQKISSKVAGDSNDENNSPNKLFLTNTQVSSVRKAFASNSSANIKLSKTHLHRIGKSGGYLGKTGLPWIRNLPIVLVPIQLTAAASATGADIQNNFFMIRYVNINNFKQGNEWYHENS